jgi:aryl-alcohol dehydrogenase-like predicted oxidoreductase
MTRRKFLELALALTAAPALGGASDGARPASASDVPQRRLGRTGQLVSIVGLGGAHIGIQPTEAESIRIIRAAVDAGITFLDNSWDYNGGQSEIRMGNALQGGYRERVFLMTKFDGRDRRSAAAQIDESLRRLRTDHVDLLQIHEVIRESDPDRVFAPGGAIEALVAARQAGKTRYVGFTGHKSPAMHLKMLEAAGRHGFRFDAVQMPLNVMDAHHASFEKRVLPVLVREEIGVLGMKPMGDKYILESKAATAPECLRYSLSLPASVVITGIDSMPVLEQALRVARGFTPLTVKQVLQLLAQTAGAAASGRWEKYKTTHVFDSTVRHPEWLG